MLSKTICSTEIDALINFHRDFYIYHKSSEVKHDKIIMRHLISRGNKNPTKKGFTEKESKKLLQPAKTQIFY